MRSWRIALVALVSLSLPPAADSGPVLATQPNGRSEALEADADPIANAPWFNGEVDTAGDTGLHAAVVIDHSLGDVYISYLDATNEHLRVARYVGTGGNCGDKDDWQCHTIDGMSDVGQYSSLAVRYGDLSVAYQDTASGDLRHAVGVFGQPSYWTDYVIDKGVFPSTTGLNPSMTIQESGVSLISYQTSDPGGVDELRLAYYVHSGGNCGYGSTPGRWQCITIHAGPDVGQHSSIVSDSDSRVHIAYYDAANADLWYATNTSGANCGPGNSWTCYQVSTLNDVGRYASMYVDGASSFHIAYYDATADELKYRVR